MTMIVPLFSRVLPLPAGGTPQPRRGQLHRSCSTNLLIYATYGPTNQFFGMPAATTRQRGKWRHDGPGNRQRTANRIRKSHGNAPPAYLTLIGPCEVAHDTYQIAQSRGDVASYPQAAVKQRLHVTHCRLTAFSSVLTEAPRAEGPAFPPRKERCHVHFDAGAVDRLPLSPESS
ncbi:MAG: hypothetical protein KDA99_13370 [Planctomycetales bacterium]|nr:hypothetical protein [Planctomycetales bacterium]